MIFPEGVLYDYSAFGTTKTAGIHTLKQLIDTPNSTMVPPRGIEPRSTDPQSVILSIKLWGLVLKYVYGSSSSDNTEILLHGGEPFLTAKS